MEVKRLETAVVDHVSTTWRLVTCKINNDVDMSPAGLLLLVSRDGSRKEVDCDPRMGLVRILSSTRGRILTCDPRGQAWGLPTTSQVCSSWWLCRMRGATTRHLGPQARRGGSGNKVITCAPKARSVSNFQVKLWEFQLYTADIW